MVWDIPRRGRLLAWVINVQLRSTSIVWVLNDMLIIANVVATADM